MQRIFRSALFFSVCLLIALPLAAQETNDDEVPVIAAADDLPPPPVPEPQRRRCSFARLAAGAFGLLLSLAFGLWVDRLIADLFTRADWLGYTALGALAIGLLAVALLLPGLRPWAWVFGTLVVVVSAVAVVLLTRARRRAGQG